MGSLCGVLYITDDLVNVMNILLINVNVKEINVYWTKRTKVTKMVLCESDSKNILKQNFN